MPKYNESYYHGRILDYDGEPIPGASVKVWPSGWIAEADEEGFFETPFLKYRTRYHLIFRRPIDWYNWPQGWITGHVNREVEHSVWLGAAPVHVDHTFKEYAERERPANNYKEI